jgi:hypothetical protein
MAKLFGELLFVIVRFLIQVLMSSFLILTAQKFMAWLDTKVHGRWAKILVGGLLGVAAYFLYPMMMVLVR